MPVKPDVATRAEKVLKVVTTYGLSVVVSVVLLGYFLWKDYHTQQVLLEAVNNNTAAMQSMITQIDEHTAAIRELRTQLHDK